jgi:hypothetical protein
MSDRPRILYCHCAYAKVVPEDVKQQVLRQLVESDAAFDAVADLCEMSAVRDPALTELAGEGALCIAACFPRAVKWLFHAAGAPLPAAEVTFANMRTESVDEILTKAGVAQSSEAP